MSAAINSLRQIAARSLSPQLKRLHTSRSLGEVFTATDAVMPQPQRTSALGVIGVTVASGVGIYAGGVMSMHMAAWLEENELFTPQDDDDEDDD